MVAHTFNSGTRRHRQAEFKASLVYVERNKGAESLVRIDRDKKSEMPKATNTQFIANVQ